MTIDAIKNTEINMNDEIINQIKLITRENGIAWLAKTCRIILTELVKPNEINICISLCKIMDLLEKNESERDGYLHIISLLEAKGIEEMLNDSSPEPIENCFEGFEETALRTKEDENTIRETVNSESEKEKELEEILKININSSKKSALKWRLGLRAALITGATMAGNTIKFPWYFQSCHVD